MKGCPLKCITFLSESNKFPANNENLLTSMYSEEYGKCLEKVNKYYNADRKK